MLAHQRPLNNDHIHNQSTQSTSNSSNSGNRYRTSIASTQSSQSSQSHYHQPPELFIGTFDFETQEPDQVPFKRGTVLPIVLKEPSGWWAAQVNGRYGWVPAAFLEPWSPPQPNSGVSTVSPSLSMAPTSLSLGGQLSPSNTGTGVAGAAGMGMGMRPRGSITAQSVADLPLYTEEDNTYDDDGHSPEHEYYGGGGGVDHHRLSSEYTEEGPITPGHIGGGGGRGMMGLDDDDTEDEDDPLVSDLVAQFSGSEIAQGPGGRRTGGSGALPPYAMFSPHSTSSNPSPTSYNNYNNTFNSRSGGNNSGGDSRDFYAPPYDPPIPHQLSLVLEEGSDVNSQWSMPHSSQAFSHTSSASALKKVNRRGAGGEKQGYSSSLSPGGSNTNSNSNHNTGGSGSLRSPTSPSNAASSSSISTAALHRLRIAHSSTPWYLRPKHLWDELKLDADGLVVAGTAPALIERLVMDSTLAPNQEAAFRSTMLMTFKNWTTAENLYDCLLLHYTMSEPDGLGPAEALEWKEKKLRPTQMRVLCVFGLWIEKHGLMMDDPGLVPKLRTWLSTILSPTGLALSAKQLVQSIDRIQHADDTSQQPSTSPTSAFGHLGASLRRKPKPPKSDFLKWDSSEVANHLTLAEARAYGRIRPCECLAWTRAGGKVKKDAVGLTAETPVSPGTGTGPGSPSGHAGPAGGDQGPGGGAGEVKNLMAFIAKSDRLAMWVKNTVLCCESLGRRADMIDFWIKIAERCRNLNNIFSMSAIVAALSGGDVGKLHLTWAHVSRASNFEQMVRLTDPTGSFSAYRALHASLSNQPDGTSLSGTNAATGNPGRDSILPTSPSTTSSTSPTSSLSLSISTLSGRDGSSSSAGPACVPFISPFLTELMHINDQYPTTLQTPQGPEPSQAPPRPLINVVKLQRQAEVIANMLRFVDRSNLNGTNHNCGGKGSSADGYRAIAEKENPAMVAAMEAQMESAAAEAKKDAGYFWKRSQELQGMEVTHADIWKNLNDAGF